MANGVRACCARDLDLALGDQRPRNGGAEQVEPFVESICPEHGKHVIAHEILAQILDIDLPDAKQFRLLTRRLKLLALAEIGGKGHHLATVGHLQPFQNDRGVEPPE